MIGVIKRQSRWSQLGQAVDGGQEWWFSAVEVMPSVSTRRRKLESGDGGNSFWVFGWHAGCQSQRLLAVI